MGLYTERDNVLGWFYRGLGGVLVLAIAVQSGVAQTTSRATADRDQGCAASVAVFVRVDVLMPRVLACRYAARAASFWADSQNAGLGADSIRGPVSRALIEEIRDFRESGGSRSLVRVTLFFLEDRRTVTAFIDLVTGRITAGVS
jgi:hypothetical protein